MRIGFLHGLGPLLSILLIPAFCQAAYITDNIDLEVHAQPLGQGAVLATINSGDSVEVLSSDGDYARITTKNNITGWIEARYLSDEINTRTELQTLQTKVRDLQAELNTTKDALSKTQKSSLSDTELKTLQKNAKDAGWMRVELKKARDQIKELEDAAKSRKASSSDAQKELTDLRAQNTELQQKLGAALLISNAQGDSNMEDVTEAPAEDNGEASVTASTTEPAQDHAGMQIKLEWFLGSIVSAIIIGIIVGMVWLDKRMRSRHGGFRLY